ncbi:hypothetical protein PORY_002829 [Pneumocystis oryctolagi]|uniref:Uncharacterized protein n=1 Tax=Pneumocystis oryctolagi TaxID=42067 RepID=A0ACB7CA20_9ASCO|nr:hypothetical protein PORY_002829 [Pneumocystis oryctolagi]
MRLVSSLFIIFSYVIQYGISFESHDLNAPAENLNKPFDASPVEVLSEVFDKPLSDRLNYRLIQISNGMKIMLISDPGSDRAGASVSVGAGSFSDPKEYPGMAHFCEHLVFMGTKKYPEEDGFSLYLSSHGGTYNAYTTSEETNYFFEVDSDHLEGSLDRLAQFFVSPLFREDAVKRESHAVDSEHKKNLRSDPWRREEVRKRTSNSTHPFSTFSTGNLYTLNVGPRKKNKSVADEVHKFFNTNYVSAVMKVAVYGKESLDDLQKMAVKVFSQIPKKEVSTPKIQGSPLDGKLGTYFVYKPLFSSGEIHLEFLIPDQSRLYKSHPLYYLQYILTFEGPTSPVAYLRKLGYASYIRFEYMHLRNGNDILDVIIGLSGSLSVSYKVVIKEFFSCLKYYKDRGIKQEVFEEIKTIQNMNFNYRPKPGVIDYVSELSSTMQNPHLPYQHILNSYVLKEFSKEDIESLFNVLTPDNFRLSMDLQYFGNRFNQTEEYYDSRYVEGTMESTFIQELKNVGNPIRLLGYPKNPHISKNLEITMEKLDRPPTKPVLYRESKICSLWVVHGSSSHVPRGTVTILLRGPVSHFTSLDQVRLDLLVEYINYALGDDRYYYSMAGTNIHVKSVYHGIEIIIDAYSDKIMEVFNSFIELINEDLIVSEVFDGIRQMFFFKYLATPSYPFSLARLASKMFFFPHVFTPRELLYEISILKLSELFAFFYDFFSNLYFDILIVGNVHPEDSLHISYMLEAVFTPRPILPSEFLNPRAIIMKRNSSYYVELENPDDDDPSSAIQYYCEVASILDAKKASALSVLSSILDHHAYDVLRTHEQLGYIVRGFLMQLETVLGYAVVIQSERQPYVLESRINRFFEESLNYISNLPDDVFASYVESTMNSLKSLPRSMIGESRKLWGSIYYRTYDFDTVNETISVYLSLKKSDVVDLYKQTIYDGSRMSRKKLSHLVASAMNSKNFHIDDIPYPKLSNYLATAMKVSISEEELKEISYKCVNTTVFMATLLDKVANMKNLTAQQKGEHATGLEAFFLDTYSSYKSLLMKQLGESIKDVREYKTFSAHSHAISRYALVDPSKVELNIEKAIENLVKCGKPFFWRSSLLSMTRSYPEYDYRSSYPLIGRHSNSYELEHMRSRSVVNSLSYNTGQYYYNQRPSGYTEQFLSSRWKNKSNNECNPCTTLEKMSNAEQSAFFHNEMVKTSVKDKSFNVNDDDAMFLGLPVASKTSSSYIHDELGLKNCSASASALQQGSSYQYPFTCFQGHSTNMNSITENRVTNSVNSNNAMNKNSSFFYRKKSNSVMENNEVLSLVSTNKMRNMIAPIGTKSSSISSFDSLNKQILDAAAVVKPLQYCFSSDSDLKNNIDNDSLKKYVESEVPASYSWNSRIWNDNVKNFGITSNSNGVGLDVLC